MKNLVIALFLAAFFAANAFSQTAEAQVPVKVNVDATVSIQPDDGVEGEGDTQSVTANTEKTLTLQLKYIGGGGGDVSPILSQQAKAPVVSFSRGTVSLELHQQTFKNADISLFSINGKQVLRGRSSMSANLPEGVYVLSVKGANGKFFSSKLAHGGGKLSINVSFGGDASSSNILRKAGDYGSWVVTAKAEGYRDTMYAFHPDEGTNPTQNITLTQLKSGEISVALACLDLQSSVVRGSEISVPEVKCSDNSTPSDISWTGRPGGNGTWATSTGSSTASYTIGVTAKCGGESLTASCGTVNVVAAASSSSAATASSSSATATSSSSRASSSSGVSVPLPDGSFTQKVTRDGVEVDIDMVYIPGGTFTLGCDKSSGCPANTTPVEGVKVSNYFLGKTEVTNDQWWAVMGWYWTYTFPNGYNGDMELAKVTTRPSSSSRTTSVTQMTWYDAFEFACELSKKTGRNYRMMTEAEFEYAAKNHLSSFEKIGGSNNNEEWAYNIWSATHSGGTDPIGPLGDLHNQHTRRDATSASTDVTARLIRSIEGVGPALRLAVSAEMDYPPNYVPSCEIHAPEMEDEPVNSYRDLRWVTGGNQRWTTSGDIAIGTFDLRVWEDGTATVRGYNDRYQMVDIPGQWFTSNNMVFMFVPSTGTTFRKYAYIFLDKTHASLISDAGYTNGYIGRIVREDASEVAKPAIANLKSGEALAREQTDFETHYKMVDMVNIPASAKKQDTRLLDGPNQGWGQMNQGSAHHYRKDVDLDEFRFTVNQGGSGMILANGDWFTVNNVFLRVTHKTGYTADYLYAVTGSGADATFYHNSFMGYERGDFRMFSKRDNGADKGWLCGSACSDEILKGQDASFYRSMDNGKSTFVPAPCPAGGCPP